MGHSTWWEVCGGNMWLGFLTSCQMRKEKGMLELSGLPPSSHFIHRRTPHHGIGNSITFHGRSSLSSLSLESRSQTHSKMHHKNALGISSFISHHTHQEWRITQAFYDQSMFLLEMIPKKMNVSPQNTGLRTLTANLVIIIKNYRRPEHLNTRNAMWNRNTVS